MQSLQIQWIDFLRRVIVKIMFRRNIYIGSKSKRSTRKFRSSFSRYYMHSTVFNILNSSMTFVSYSSLRDLTFFRLMQTQTLSTYFMTKIYKYILFYTKRLNQLIEFFLYLLNIHKQDFQHSVNNRRLGEVPWFSRVHVIVS